MVALSAGIYHISILNVTESDYYRFQDGRPPAKLFCVESKVLTAIKGPSLSYTRIDPEYGNIFECLRFSYDKGWPTIYMDSDRRTMGFNYRDTLYTPLQYGGLPTPSVGDEYILFTTIDMESHIDSIGMPYNVFPLYGYSRNGGLFKISSGYVRDIDNVFGEGNIVSAQVFLSKIDDIVTSLSQE